MNPMLKGNMVRLKTIKLSDYKYFLSMYNTILNNIIKEDKTEVIKKYFIRIANNKEKELRCFRVDMTGIVNGKYIENKWVGFCGVRHINNRQAQAWLAFYEDPRLSGACALDISDILLKVINMKGNICDTVVISEAFIDINTLQIVY